nr:isocitrate lyase/phosphoenolpyruvate mutase family protein [Rhizobium leguminosarum]
MTMIGNRKKVKFRDLVSRKQVFTPCVWDCYSAKAAEMAGFEAILLSGASLGFSMSGVPDLGLHNQEELVYATDRIADYSPLPLVIDADDGFGDVVQTFRTCYRLFREISGRPCSASSPWQNSWSTGRQ